MTSVDDTIVLFGATKANPDLRHQVPVEIHDELLYFEHDGRRVVVTSVLEQPRVQAVGEYEILLLEELGRDALVRELGSRPRANRRAMANALLQAGVTEASVPSAFPLGFARELQEGGVALRIADERFTALRRVKTGAELAGMRRAQAAADAAVDLVREALSAAETRGGELHLDGAPLTVERLKTAVRAELAERDASLDEFILSHGSQSAIGHHAGAGVLEAGEPILVDLWPTDRASGCCTDMTRTFVVGDPPPWLVERHSLCVQALDAVLRAVKPGTPCERLHAIACELFEDHGYRTPLSRRGSEPLVDGFPYALGHGLGLEMHEAPVLMSGERDRLVEGDVIAIEPGLYEQGVGGVRIEDVYLVTANGPERIGRLDHALMPR